MSCHVESKILERADKFESDCTEYNRPLVQLQPKTLIDLNPKSEYPLDRDMKSYYYYFIFFAYREGSGICVSVGVSNIKGSAIYIYLRSS